MKTWTKICGIKTIETLDAAIEGGADYIGLVFFQKSPRNVSLETAAALATAARGRTRIAALVVDASDDQLAAIADRVAPDVLQLHGAESPARLSHIRALVPGSHLWKAVPVSTPNDAARAFDYAAIVDRILFDAKPPKGADLPGGNGHAFDWSALDAVKSRLEYMLSGGLTPENVAAAIEATQPWGVDVSSGVESAPGVKAPSLIQAFLRAAKASTQTF